MNKQEFITAIAEKTGQTKTATDLFIGAFFDVVEETLCKGEDITLVGKAKFEVVETQARKGHNPQTGEQIDIEASVKAKATLGSPIKKAVKEALTK